MTERQLQFRVGLFVISAAAVAGVIVFQFGELRTLWQRKYTVTIHFDSAPGVQPFTPVKRNGMSIGRVIEVAFDEEHGGVIVRAEILAEHRLREDSHPRVVRSLLGDTDIDIQPGRSSVFLKPGDRLIGEATADPMEIVSRLERGMSTALQSFRETSLEWQRVARNVNNLMDTKHGNLNTVVERAAVSLEQFTRTMRSANRVLEHAGSIFADPKQRENLKQTLAALPRLVEDTRLTVSAVRAAVEKVDRNLNNLNEITAPLAAKSRSMTARMDSTLGNLQTISAELATFSKLLRRPDGSLQKLLTDPELYRNMNRSAAALSVLLKNLQPVIYDLRVFSDKIARHPEMIGVRGALRSSSGLKEDPPPDRQRSGVRPTSGTRRQ